MWAPKLVEAYEGNLENLRQATGAALPNAELPEADRLLASTLIERDAFALADTLGGLGGSGVAQIIFGIGVVGMAVSSIIILMLINGFALCEMTGRPSRGRLYRIGALLPAITGAIGALFLWSGRSKFYLAVPTSRFGMVLLPIAYIAFFCLMNHRGLMGKSLPGGGVRIVWNVLMSIGILLALSGAALSIWNDKTVIPETTIMVKHLAMGLAGFLLLASVSIHFLRRR